jgi:hypothetical protein
MANEKRLIVTEKQLLALKAVAYGCNKNKRLVGATYVSDIFDENPQEISFFDALNIVYEIIDEMDGDGNV